MRARTVANAGLLACAIALTGCTTLGRDASPLATVPRVDLVRYSGTWYEIARYPNRFQSQCAGDVTAQYSPRDDGTIEVINACRRADGTLDRALGTARVADPATNAQLEVRFAPAALAWLPLVWGDYYVIALAPDYRYALVGAPSRDYLWVLSRTPALAEADYAQLAEAARRAGFDPARLQRTNQSAKPPRG